MNKTWTILRHEVYMLLRRFSFWFAVLGVPLLGFVVYGGAAWINQRESTGDDTVNRAVSSVQQILVPQKDSRPQGYVDPGGLIRVFPKKSSPTKLIAFQDEQAARRALSSGNISLFYVISPDYQQSGRLIVYMTDYSLTTSSNRADMENLIKYNLLGGNTELVEDINEPIRDLVEVSVAPQTGAASQQNYSFFLFLSFGVAMLFFTGIMGSSTLLLNSLTDEKENRVMEVLLISSSPNELLLGKIAELGLVGLLQMAIWMASALILMQLGGQTFQLPPGMVLTPSFVAWGIVFFLLGYLVYAALMAGIGVMVPNLRETSQVSTLLMLPMMVPAFLFPAIADTPNSVLSIVISLIPFTAPSMMMMRLATETVPLWQLLLSAGILAGTFLFVIRVVARMFRAQALLSGQALNLKRFWRVLRKDRFLSKKEGG